MSEAHPKSPPPADPGPQSPRRKSSGFWRVFWLSFLVLSFGYAWYSFYVPSNSIAWAEDYASAQQQATLSGKPVILFFTAEWCVPCRIMKRNVWADEQVEETVNSGFTPVMIDTDDTVAAEAALERYSVRYTPTTIVTDPQGNVLRQVEGGIGKSEFLQLLEKPNPSAAAPAH